jgi:hypothetical protein
MEEHELKAAFAAFLLETPQSPMTAALKLFPAEKDRGRVCEITFSWPSDPEVIIAMERLKKDEGTGSKVPSKEEVIQHLWELSKNERTPPKDKAVCARTVAEMLNYIPKGDSDETSKRRMPAMPVYKVVQE